MTTMPRNEVSGGLQDVLIAWCVSNQAFRRSQIDPLTTLFFAQIHAAVIQSTPRMNIVLGPAATTREPVRLVLGYHRRAGSSSAFSSFSILLPSLKYMEDKSGAHVQDSLGYRESPRLLESTMPLSDCLRDVALESASVMQYLSMTSDSTASLCNLSSATAVDVRALQ